MPLEQKLKEELEQGQEPRKIIVECSVDDVHKYLDSRRIKHCSLAAYSRVYIEFMTPEELELLEENYHSRIGNVWADSSDRNILDKLGVSFITIPKGYEMSGADIGGKALIRHSQSFNLNAPYLKIGTLSESIFTGTYEQLFEVLAYSSVIKALRLAKKSY